MAFRFNVWRNKPERSTVPDFNLGKFGIENINYLSVHRGHGFIKLHHGKYRFYRGLGEGSSSIKVVCQIQMDYQTQKNKQEILKLLRDTPVFYFEPPDWYGVIIEDGQVLRVPDDIPYGIQGYVQDQFATNYSNNIIPSDLIARDDMDPMGIMLEDEGRNLQFQVVQI